MTRIVISGVNLKEGGILSILLDCLSSLREVKKGDSLHVTVLVHSKKLVKDFLDDYEIEEYPEIKTSWLKRIKFEYFDCLEISKRLSPDIWISLHDMTPRLNCKYQVVYCHNTSSFFTLRPSEIFTDITFFLFNQFYKYLYAINIKRNQFVILQQQWLRTEFERRYKIKGIVAHPNLNKEVVHPLLTSNSDNGKLKIFFYPSFPRVFKNFEIIMKAAEKLHDKKANFKVIVTMDGSENKYSKGIFDRYGNKPYIDFVGLMDREKVYSYYESSDCLIFPSRLESWGLPISEYKEFGKPIICADLPYAHETIDGYPLTKFFTVDDVDVLTKHMEDFCLNRITWDQPVHVKTHQPFFKNWNDLLNFLITDYRTKNSNYV